MFSVQNLQINRGVTTANAQGVLTLIKHSYKDKSNTIANIIANFPPYFAQGANQEFIRVGDLIDLSGSDQVTVNEILSLNPVSLGPNLYLASSTVISAAVPIAAVDNNAVKITGDVIQMEIADASRPGIVSNTGQTFGGAKTFAGGVLSNSVDAASVGALTLGQTNANAISLRQTTTIVSGKELRTNTIDATTSGTLTIDNAIATLVNIKPVILSNGGALWPSPGGNSSLFNYYEEYSFDTTFSNNGSTTTSTTVVLTRVGNVVTMRFSNEVTGTNSGSPAPNYTSDVQIPSRFMAAINPLNGWWRIFDNGSYRTGLIQFDGSGSIYMFFDPNQSFTWTPFTSMGISACAFSWVI